MPTPSLDNGYARAGVLLTALTALVAAVLLLTVSSPASADHAGTERPNVLMIVTDDQEFSTMTSKFMPKTIRHLAERGSWFEDFVVTTPLCCPSRATQLTGQYGHNNGVLANKPGYPSLQDPDNVLPVWLQEAGYSTAHIGKFLNGYRRTNADSNTPAPGWDVWYTTERQRYYDYTISNNGSPVYKGRRKRDYSTDVYTRKALALINGRFGAKQDPYYMQLDYLAPHADGGTKGRCQLSAIPARRDRDLYPNLRLPRTSSFNETDVSDKPRFVREIPELRRTAIQQIRRRYLCRVRSLRAVDRGVNKIIRALDRNGALENTVVMLYSDNGYHSGEHRVAKSKGLAYEESIKVPLMVRLPDSLLNAGSVVPTVSEPVANIDLVPTILELAGADPCATDDPESCRVLDGRSFLELIDNTEAPEWPDPRPIGIEIAQDGELAGGTRACNYYAVRVEGEIFVQHERSLDPITKECFDTDEIEHYRMADDPAELDNLYPGPPLSQLADDQIALATLLEEIRVCAGIAGRDPEPDSGEYCP